MRIPIYERDQVSRVIEQAMVDAFTGVVGLAPDCVSTQYLKIYAPRWQLEVTLRGCSVSVRASDEDLRVLGGYEKAGQQFGRLLATQWQEKANLMGVGDQGPA